MAKPVADESNPGEPLVGRGAALRTDGATVAGDAPDPPAGEPAVEGASGAAARSVPRPALRPERERPWSRWRMAVPQPRLALGVGLVVVLAGAWLAVGRAAVVDGALPPTGVGAATAPTVPTVPTAGASTTTAAPARVATPIAVPRWVPLAIAATCRARGAGAVNNVTVDCTPGRGVARLRYRGFATVAAERGAYAVAGHGTGGDGPPACAQGVPDERSWSEAATPTRARGRYRCLLIAGRARIEWTSDDARVLGVATRADADLRLLYQWWTTVPGPTATADLPEDR